jgi:hypothetical protein
MKSEKGKDGFQYGFQFNPGPKTAVGSFLYSLGVPGMYGGRQTSVNNDAMLGLLANTAYQSQMGGGGGGQAQQPINFLPEGYGGSQIRNRMRGGMMGLNYRLRG